MADRSLSMPSSSVLSLLVVYIMAIGQHICVKLRETEFSDDRSVLSSEIIESLGIRCRRGLMAKRRMRRITFTTLNLTIVLCSDVPSCQLPTVTVLLFSKKDSNECYYWGISFFRINLLLPSSVFQQYIFHLLAYYSLLSISRCTAGGSPIDVAHQGLINMEAMGWRWPESSNMSRQRYCQRSVHIPLEKTHS